MAGTVARQGSALDDIRVSGAAAEHQLDAVDPAQPVEPRLVADLDALVEECGLLDLLERVGERGDELVESGAVDRDQEARVCAELPDAEGYRSADAVGQVDRGASEPLREEEDRVDAAHLGEDRNRLAAARGEVEERATAAERTREADRLGRGVLDHLGADRVSLAVQQRERALGESGIGDGLRDHAADHLRRPRVVRVRLDDDRAARGECRRGVAAGNREREREVRRAEHTDRPDRAVHRAEVGLGQRLTLAVRVVDPQVEVRAVPDQRGEHPELRAGASAFTRQAREREPGLGAGTLEQRISESLDADRDRFEERRARRAAVVLESRMRGVGEAERAVDLGRRGVVERSRERCPGAGVDRGERGFGFGRGRAADQMLSVQFHVGRVVGRVTARRAGIIARAAA